MALLIIYYRRVDNKLFLDKEMVEQLERSNHPKTELSLLEHDNQDIKLILKHDEVKYVCIKPN